MSSITKNQVNENQKTQVIYHLTTEWFLSKIRKRATSDEDMAKSKPLYIAGENIKQYSHYWEQYEESSKTRSRIVIWPNNSIWVLIQKFEIHISKRHSHSHAHYSTMHKSKITEAAEVAIHKSITKTMSSISLLIYTIFIVFVVEN